MDDEKPVTRAEFDSGLRNLERLSVVETRLLALETRLPPSAL
jgi:hypothetical protein